MKKLLSALLAVVMVFAFAGCGEKKTEDDGSKAAKTIKAGFIFLHDDKSTYDKNFMDAARKAQQNLGLTDDQVIFKDSVPEAKDCYDAAADLVDQGCNVIFADSFGHEEWMIKAAKEFTDVQFCHATGTKAHTENLPNYHNAFASIYEGRYLAGIAAGLKLNEQIAEGKYTAADAVLGYVGAFPYAEVISGYTSFYLGAKSVCPTATMLVDFTNSWYSPDAERDVANALISKGCKVISQHADSMGAPSVCEEGKIPNIFYNGTTVDTCPNTYVIASKINWAPYFEYMINCVKEDKSIDTDWCGTLANGSVVLEKLNENVAAKGTQEAIDAAATKLKEGTLHVFDVKSFTVTVTDKKNTGAKVDADGHLTSYTADIDDAGDFVPETEVVSNGFFHESEKRSAPCFDIEIDGITRLDK